MKRMARLLGAVPRTESGQWNNDFKVLHFVEHEIYFGFGVLLLASAKVFRVQITKFSGPQNFI
jgi:hypothetical protein